MEIYLGRDIWVEIHTWEEIYGWRYIRGLIYLVEDTLEDIRVGGQLKKELELINSGI